MYKLHVGHADFVPPHPHGMPRCRRQLLVQDAKGDGGKIQGFLGNEPVSDTTRPHRRKCTANECTSIYSSLVIRNLEFF
jgi:hypothetical protein